MKITRLVIVILLGISIGISAGCNIVGFIASPTYHEQKIPAEFKLKSRNKEGLLVFIDGAAGSNTRADIKSELSSIIETFLVKKAGIKKNYLVSSSELSRLQVQRSDFSRLTPVQIGSETGAGLVLYVLIGDYKLYGLGKHKYYSGSLVTRSILLDVSSGQVLWPEDGQGKLSRVKVELETTGRQAAMNRLTTTTAHCIVRSFYDCPRAGYKSSDEQTEYDEQDW